MTRACFEDDVREKRGGGRRPYNIGRGSGSFLSHQRGVNSLLEGSESCKVNILRGKGGGVLIFYQKRGKGIISYIFGREGGKEGAVALL